jgi:hypothetical protein|tara:strand:+ start:1025 stop:1318 length:294 start_codon:yes stop_codon:yes gene_type:complete
MGDCGNTVAVGMSSYALVGVLGGVLGGLARSASAYVEINALEKCSESSRARSRGSNSALKSSSSACSAPERRISKDKVFGTVLARNLGARARQTEKA